jgi:hypothetical protein
LGIKFVLIVTIKTPYIRGGSRDSRSFDIGRALTSVNLIQSSLDCRTNVEQFNHQCFERSAKICEPLSIEANNLEYAGDK